MSSVRSEGTDDTPEGTARSDGADTPRRKPTEKDKDKDPPPSRVRVSVRVRPEVSEREQGTGHLLCQGGRLWLVEGGEGGGFKNPRDVSTMVLLPLVRSRVDVPIIAAGGFVDGASMAAAFALGAEAVQMGTRMVSAAESPVHENWKNAIVEAKETDTVFLNRAHSPALRALRTEKTSRLEFDSETNAMTEFGTALDLYFGGDMEASIALSGQVAGRIDSVRPVAEVIAEVKEEFFATIGNLSSQYL